MPAHLPRHLRRFLGQDRQVRGQLAQPAQDHLVGGQVGGGHRAAVGFDLDIEGGGVHRHDGGGGVLGNGNDRFAQIGGEFDHSPRSSHWRAMNNAASERPSEKSSRSINRSSSAIFQGTTSSSSGSSPTKRSG
ncbi:hypothetical protein D9M71_762970 [compost metagenome]